MKKVIYFALTVIIVLSLVPFCVSAADGYADAGLIARYDGDNNTGGGQDKTATVWKDLSGNGNDITNVVNDKYSSFSDDAYILDSYGLDLPDKITDVVNSDAYTIEVEMGGIESYADSFINFFTARNDHLAFFLRLDGDYLEYKASTSDTGNDRPKVENGFDLLVNSTVAVTFDLSGDIIMYCDGVELMRTTPVTAIDADVIMLGHDDAARLYKGEFKSVRVYDRALSAEEIAANYAADKLSYADRAAEAAKVEAAAAEAEAKTAELEAILNTPIVEAPPAVEAAPTATPAAQTSDTFAAAAIILTLCAAAFVTTKKRG